MRPTASLLPAALVASTLVGCDSEGDLSAVADRAAPAATEQAPEPGPEAEPAPEAATTKAIEAPPEERTPLDRTFDDVKFDIEPDDDFDRSMLTDTIRDLDGERVRIRGYILPTAQKRGIKQFVLVRDNQECCFGPGAALYDCILVTMAPGETTEFSVRPVAVEGEFTVDEFYGPDDRPLAIYRMAGEEVR